MKKLIVTLLVLTLVFSMVACSGGKKADADTGDVLKGTWTCEDKDYGTITWDFDGNGKCKMEHDYYGSEGTYTIDGTQVSIKLDGWDDTKLYDFTTGDNSLKLTATDALSGDYDMTRK